MTTLWTRVEAAASGQEQALEWLVNSYYVPVHAVVVKLLRSWRVPDGDALADDFVQSAFLQLLNDPSPLQRASREHGGRFRSYMIAVVKGLVRNELRKHRRRASNTDPELMDTFGSPDNGDGADKELEQVWLSGVLLEAFERLRIEYRKAGHDEESCIVAMSVLEERKVADIAKTMDWKAEDVSRVLWRARGRMRHHVKSVVRDQHNAWQAESGRMAAVIDEDD
jgi:RNA polymerase sigma factor (sigma-70 family)